MSEQAPALTDLDRLTKLQALAQSGLIEGPFSYFGHLIKIHGQIDRTGSRRAFTQRERERVDLLLKTFAH